MRVRSFHASDISSAAEVLALCNKTDSLGHFIYKDIDKYPTSYRLCHVKFMREKVLGIGTVAHVVETEISDYPPEEQHRSPEVVGFAVWRRLGSSDVAKKWQAPGLTLSTRLERALTAMEARYYKLFPSAQPTWSGENFAKVLPLLVDCWDPQVFAEAWELQLLFVHPDRQRQGVGKKLMKWGVEKAQEEKVPIVVKSSPLGGAAYRAAGFRPFKEIGLAVHFDPLTFGGELSKAWVWEPALEEGDGVEGNWHERVTALIAAQQSSAKA